jgi:DNA-binding transcriptional ArsR family regulator
VERKEAIETVRESQSREEIIRELYHEPDQIISELLLTLENIPQVESREKLTTAIEELKKIGLIDVADQFEGRMAEYSLTDFGKVVAEELGLNRGRDLPDADAFEVAALDLDVDGTDDSSTVDESNVEQVSEDLENYLNNTPYASLAAIRYALANLADDEDKE